MRYRPGAHRSFRPRHRHWLRGLVLAVLKCDMPLKAFFCLRRIAGGNWIRNVTR